MKTIIKYILSFVFIILIILTPSIILDGTRSGLMLWYYALIPALLPYMILSNIVIKSGLSMELSFLTYPLTKLLRINPKASYCILSGIFFGYPACAANACALVKEKQLDQETASFCSCAFNNLSPGFIMGFFCIGTLGNTEIIPKVFALFYISLLLSTFLIRILFFRNLKSTTENIMSVQKTSDKNILTSSIKTALINIATLGGYVIVFAILIQYLLNIPYDKITLLAPFLEITTGINIICNTFTDIKTVLLIIMPLLSFGGISGIFQTLGIDSDRIIDTKKYIYSKVLSGIVSLIVTYLAVYVLEIIP